MRTAPSKFWTFLIALFVGLGLTALGAASPAAADAGITLDKKAPGSVLLGDPVPYTLTASNPAGNDSLYNVSFSDILPAGFEYVGPTDPASAGEPTITTTPGGQTLLVWNNVTDLQAASSFTLKFEAELKAPVPTTIVPVDTNTAYVAGSINERKVPKFNSNGTPVADLEVVSDDDTAPTERAPFVVEKRNTNSPEGELLRGVHDQRSTYTLTIRNNKVVPTNNVTLTDYLPAQLEFLGCGNEDNSQVVTEEFPGSGPLGAPPVDPTPCPLPVSVETVDSPQGVPGLGNLSGVYTAVTWNVGDLAAGEVKEIKYVAGIPLSENTTTWDSPEPSAASLKQGSNLDNNNGDSTREGIPEQSITNKVSAAGVFTGTAPTSPSIVTEEHTVTIEDVRMQKSVSPSDGFTPGGTAVFTMKIEASEYMDASNTVVTDTLPDGYCPLGATGSTNWPGEPDCTALAGDPKPSPGFSSVTWNPDPGNYTVVFDPVPEINANQSATVTLPARMLDTYRKTSQPTVAGDNFVNTVELTAQTNAIEDSDGNPVEPGEVTVGDDSRAEQGTPLPAISKQIKPRAAPPTFPGGMKCDPAVPPAYVSDPDPRPSFRKGDVICFKLRVAFPSTIDTKNAVVTDFPPVGTEFVVGDQPETGNNKYALTTNNTVDVSADLTTTSFVLTLGTGGFVPKGGVFEATFAVRVLEPGTGTAPEITGNLMKMRTENTAGVAQSYRDQAEYDLIPPPNLFIDKGVIATDKPSQTFPAVSPLQDNKPIEQGGTATFQINVENRPQIPGSDYSVRGVQVWDRLPEQLTCSAVDLSALEYIKPGTATQSALPGGIATCDNAPGGSIVKWVFPSPDLANDYSIDVDQTLSLIYTMKVPDVAAAGTDYANTSGVRQYEAFTDIPEITAEYIPENNIDPTQDAKADAPELTDPSNVFIPGVTVDKDGETSVTETNNNLKTQATIGENIRYTYSVTIAKGSTVYRGVLSDALPPGIEFVSLDSAVLVGSSTPLPDLGFTVNDTNGTLTFPTVWNNDTDADQTFRVIVTAKVGQSAASCNAATCTLPPDTVATNVKKTNTAKFESFTEQTGGTKVEKTKTYDIFVVQPNPSITKTANPTSVSSTSTDITYTLTAKTPGARPPLHNVTIIDCVPDTLTIKTVNNGGVLGTNPNCQTTDKVSITWGPFDPLVPGTDKVVTYIANIKPGSPADVRFKNTVGMSGTSMPGDVVGERTYLTGANAEVFITGAAIDKNVAPSVATVGETVSYTVDTKLPDATYANLVVLDTLPPYIDYADVSDIAVECSTTDSNYANPVACSSGVSATVLGPDPASPGATGQQIGWSFDPLPDQNKHRIIRITYKSRVSNLPQNAAGVTRTNTASAGYGYTSKPTTLAQAQNPPKPIGSDGATITLTEPNLKIEKLVNGEDAITALPDDTFGYTVKVTNPQRAGGVPTSTAFAVKVRDCVPDGISVVNAGTGTLGTDNTCATTGNVSITWPAIDSLAVGGSQQYTYTAKFKGNTTTAQTNVVSAVEWFSLPPDQANPDIRTYGPITADAVVTPVLPDVQIVKKASKSLAYIGDPYKWTIEVTNPSNRDPGPTAYQVKVADVLPPNWTYQTGSTVITFDGTEISTTDPAVDSADPLAVKLAWNTGTDLPVNKKITVTFQATPGGDVVDKPGVGTTIPHINTASTTWNPGKPADGWNPVTSPKVTAETVIASADLALTKTHVTEYTPPLQDEDNVIPGTQFKWKVKVTNNGPDNAVGPYVVVDTLPAGNTYVSSQGTDWACDQDSVDTQKITCTHPNVAPDGLAPGDTLLDLFHTVSVDIDAPQAMENTATVTGETYDPNLDNNTGKDKVTLLPPNVQIQKFNSDELAYIDQPYAWRLEITNPSENVPGPIAYQISANDVLPPNWTYKTGSTVISYDGSDISTDDPTVDSTDPLAVKLAWETKTDLPVNKKIIIRFQAIPQPAVATPPPGNPGVGTTIPHINTATTSWYPGTPTDDWDLQTSDEVTAQTKIASADLMLEKTHKTDYPDEWNVADDEVVPGTEFDWNIKVTNNGPDNSVGPFVVTDTLPNGTEYKSYSGSGWTCDQDSVDEQKITCTHPNVLPDGLAKDESLPTLTLIVKVDAAVTQGPLTNTATVTGKTYDPKPENNTDDDPVTPRPLADLEIVKSRTQPYVVGNQVTYTLAVTNLGPSVSVKDITVVDTLPSGLSIESIDAGPWQCQPTSGETDTLTCVLKEDLQPLEQAPLINVTVDVLESPGTEAVNTAVVTGTTEDPNLENNEDTVKDPVVSEVQLGIAKKTTGPNPVTAGQSTEFTITVSNFGPAKAKNVVVVDELQAGLKATSATGPGWSCDVGGGTTVTCTRANFPLSASPSDIVVKADVNKSVPGGTTLKNVATVTTTSPQPGGNPDPATSTVDVVAKSDLGIFKSHNGGPWTIGKKGTWNVRVVNNGPSDNPGPITVVDNLPRGNEFLSATGDGWSCSATGRTVTCVYGAGLVVGQEAGFSIRVNVVNGAAPAVVNPAEVTSPIEDTDPSNNQATDQVRVLRQTQTAGKLPPNPRVLPARKTDQGQKIRTKVRCRTLKSSAAGEVSFCKIKRKKNGTVKVKVVGTRKVKVTVIQRARGTKNYKPFKRVKTYIVRP